MISAVGSDGTATWLAGSLDFTEAEASHLQRLMEQMVEEGVAAKILRKYDLKP